MFSFHVQWSMYKMPYQTYPFFSNFLISTDSPFSMQYIFNFFKVSKYNFCWNDKVRRIWLCGAFHLTDICFKPQESSWMCNKDFNFKSTINTETSNIFLNRSYWHHLPSRNCLWNMKEVYAVYLLWFSAITG